MVAVSRCQGSPSTESTCRLVSGVTQRPPRCFILSHTIVYDPSLNLTVVLHPSSDLPYIVRSIEDHSIYGASTNDLYLTNYKAVNGLMFPHSIQTVYNSSQQFLDATLEDYIIEQVEVDPEFPSDFFDGLAVNESMTPRAAPMKVPGVSHARITEFQSNMLWGGTTHSDVDELQVQQPVPDLPTLHWLVLDNDTLGVKQLIIEFDTEVIVGDAPPQWTSSVIQWVAQHLKKPITHLWVSIYIPKLPTHRFQGRLAYTYKTQTAHPPPPRPQRRRQRVRRGGCQAHRARDGGAVLVGHPGRAARDVQRHAPLRPRRQPHPGLVPVAAAGGARVRLVVQLRRAQAALGRLARGRVRGGRVAGRHARRAVRPGPHEALAGPACPGQVDDGCRVSNSAGLTGGKYHLC